MAPLSILAHLSSMFEEASGCGVGVSILVDFFHFALNFDRLDEWLAVSVERCFRAGVQIKSVDNSAFNASGNAPP